MGESSPVQSIDRSNNSNNNNNEKRATYPFPNQLQSENSRLDGQHLVFKHRLCALYKAPLIHSTCRVLDLGCGTGIWAREFATMHPSSHVLGVDIFPPAERSVDTTSTGTGTNAPPSNCTFIKANFEDEQAWTTFAWSSSSAEPFDFIYARMLMAAVQDWPRLFRQCYAHLRPGGYLEVFEGLFELRAEDGSGPDESPAIRWFGLGQAYLANHGLKWDRALDLPAHLRAAGFDIVADIPLKMTLYPNEADPEAEREWLSQMYLDDMGGVVTNMTERVFADGAAGMTLQEGRALAEQARQDMAANRQSRGYHATL